MADVFLSYVHDDLHAAAQLARAVESCGWTVWWDRSLVPGEPFQNIIEAQLRASRAVLVLWSARSVASDWVRDEAREARNRNTLIPCLIDAIEPPLGFRQTQTANLINWTGDTSDEHFIKLLSGIQRLAPITRPGGSIADAPRNVKASAEHLTFWTNVPHGSTFTISASGDPSLADISVTIRCDGTVTIIWQTKDVLNNAAGLRIESPHAYQVDVTVSTFGASSPVAVKARLESPDGSLYKTPIEFVANEPGQRHQAQIAIITHQ